MLLDKQTLLSLFVPRVIPVSVDLGADRPDMAGPLDLFVRELSAKQVFDMQIRQKASAGSNESFATFLLSQAVCDKDGNALLTQEDAQQLLGNMNIKAFTKLSEVVAKAAGLSKPDAATEQPVPGNAS